MIPRRRHQVYIAPPHSDRDDTDEADTAGEEDSDTKDDVGAATDDSETDGEGNDVSDGSNYINLAQETPTPTPTPDPTPDPTPPTPTTLTPTEYTPVDDNKHLKVPERGGAFTKKLTDMAYQVRVYSIVYCLVY